MTLSRTSNLDLIYLPADVQGYAVGSIHARISTDAALGLLLKGTNLTFHRSDDGAILIRRQIVPADTPPAQAVPDILVVGRKTQNADIRRTSNDIQPYKVVTGEDVEASHADNVSDFARTRLPSNAEFLSPSQDSRIELGSTRSEFNLNGLGTEHTLVLVDGARLPGVPGIQELGGRAPNQPDVNAIPAMAIERIETLTSTAGGIYGPGATGGVVNIVLRRDYHGTGVTIDGSLTQHGGGDRQQITAHAGFSPDHGSTEIMLLGSWSQSSPLLAGQRDLQGRAIADLYRETGGDFTGFPQFTKSINIFTYDPVLALKQENGGLTLPSSFTSLAVGSSGNQVISSLIANAGKIDLAPSDDYKGNRSSIVANQDTLSFIGSARRRLSPAVEMFIDAVLLRNTGRFWDSSSDPYLEIGSSSPVNPFDDDVSVFFPDPGLFLKVKNQIVTYRYSAGLIIDLPRRWKGDVSIAAGGVDEKVELSGWRLSSEAIDNAYSGNPSDDGKPLLNPFGNWQQFLSAIDAYRIPTSGKIELKSRLLDANLHAAGPIVKLPGGDATLTTAIEFRREQYLPSSNTVTNYETEGVGTLEYANLTQKTASAYGELRAPVVSSTGNSLLRGLELQFAARYDDVSNRSRGPDPITFSPYGPPIRADYRTTNFTAGLRFFPLAKLMLRASIATGSIPPPVADLSPFAASVPGIADPKRQGTPTGKDGLTTIIVGGSPNLEAERARTISLGFVLNPSARNWPRISVDYSHIRKRHEVAGVTNLAWLLEHEDEYPDRIKRDPLTPEDIAAGYTAGLVTEIDGSYFSAGASRLDVVDMSFDYQLPLRGGSSLHLYATATWQPRYITNDVINSPELRMVDYSDGPLRWRGNAGIVWSRQKISVGINGQYYSKYHNISSQETQDGLSFPTSDQFVPAQFYVDLDITHHFTVGVPGGRSVPMQVRLGITNIFDKTPPVALYAGYDSYSDYGDPRQRRFDLSLTANF